MTDLRLFRKIGRCHAGTAVVELTIVMPLAILLMVGCIEFGRAISLYLAVDKTMRHATRYLARVPEAAVDGWGLTGARNLALTGTVDGSGDWLVPDWQDPGSIVLQETDTPVLHLRLTASVPFQFALLPIIGLPNQLTFTVSHEERHIGE